MNTYYKLITTIKDTFDGDLRVSTVTTSGDDDIDINKKNLYPLVHVNVIDSPFTSLDTTAVVRYNVEITVVDIRDVNKEIINDKFWLNDDRHDNWNETMSILKEAQNKLVKNINGSDVTITSSTSANRLSFSNENTLDGWQQTWTIDVPDIYTESC